MRSKLLMILGVGCLALGATCLPLNDFTAREIDTGTTLAITLLEPTAAVTVPQKTELSIKWTASNVTGDPAAASIILESRTDLSQTALVADQALTKTGESGEVMWNTQGYSGPYSIIARVQTATKSAEDKSAGLITVDPEPHFEFTAPAADVEYTQGLDPAETLTITWVSSDNAATARIGLDPDADHVSVGGEDEERNEVYLTQITLPTTSEAGSLEWAGTDESDAAVPSKDEAYYLFAVVSDGVNPDFVVNAPARIKVSDKPDDPNQPEEEPDDPNSVGLRFVEPAEDKEFLATAADFSIDYRTNQSEEITVDLKVDADDDHRNGNEKAIRPNILVGANQNPGVFLWKGTYFEGATALNLPDGIYRLFMVVTTEGGSAPQTSEAGGLVFRRSVEKKPLIALLAPATVQKVNPGGFVTIKWRDDDPAETSKVRIVLDDDDDPVADNADQIEILAGREAKGDGVQDTYSYQVPGTLTADTYYVIAYIDKEGDGTPEHSSVATGPVVVQDPAAP